MSWLLAQEIIGEVILVRVTTFVEPRDHPVPGERPEDLRQVGENHVVLKPFSVGVL